MFNTSRLSASSVVAADRLSVKARQSVCICAVSAAVYPWFLNAFHWAVTAGSAAQGGEALTITTMALAAMMLAGGFAIPLICLLMAGRSLGGSSDAIARRIALLCMTAPTAYVFFGVVTYMLGSQIADTWIWTPLWLIVGYLGCKAKTPVVSYRRAPSAQLRVAHGIAGSIAALYVLFHITNHLFGLIGPEAHAAVMSLGRRVYRSAFVEPILVMVMLFQIISGLRLAWTWSAENSDPYRIYQVASGVFMSVFVLGHMNSVFIFARTFLGIPTDWAFAAGLPTGMINDEWNIRLLPHYALGVFFVLTHLVSGLRVVAIAHNVTERNANRAWWIGSAISLTVATAIICGMAGLRLG